MSRRVPLPTLVLALAASGCGPSYHPVSGVVKLDGEPVARADVALVSEDGLKTYTGFTDSSGAFTIQSGPKPGAIAGTYKVTVTQAPDDPAARNMDPTPGGADYTKYMIKQQKEDSKTSAPKTPMPGMMPGMIPGGPGGVKANRDNVLPPVYASVKTTPLTVTVPVAGGQVALDLKGDGKKK